MELYEINENLIFFYVKTQFKLCSAKFSRKANLITINHY